ncbi:MAG: MBL fold metallo-hydrolase [Chloroflexota bacterium]
MTSSENGSVVTWVAEDIYQVRLPLPFRLNHSHAYLLRERDGWTIVDFGLHWVEAEKAWRAAFDTLQIQPESIRRLVLTHMHPDHFGMAGWFQARCSLPIVVSPLEAEQIRRIWFDHGWAPDKALPWWNHCGVPEQVSQKAAERVEFLREGTFPHPTELDLLEPDTTIEMGGRLFRTIHAPGHAEGQLLFYHEDERLLLSGDQILMKITPNIGLWPTGNGNPLANYLHSLHGLRGLDVQLALPGHGALITDWSRRIDEIIAHHNVRLEQTMEATQSSATGFDVTQFLFDIDRLSPHEIRFAVAESLAHLEYLVQMESLERTLETPYHYQHL